MLYLQNICIENETDEEIGQMVRDHAKSKGLRIMMHRVIRHRAYQDMVSVKILVPESQVYLALAPDTWPQELKCRPWSREPPRNLRRQDRGREERRYNQYDQYVTDNRQYKENKDRQYGEDREFQYGEDRERGYSDDADRQYGATGDWGESNHDY